MKRIDEVFCFVVEDDEAEGIPSVRLGDLEFPMLGADMERIDSLKPFAEAMVRQGKIVKLFRFKKISEEIVRYKASE